MTPSQRSARLARDAMAFMPAGGRGSCLMELTDRRGTAVTSLVSGGWIMSGVSLRRSLLFTGVHTHAYAHIDDVGDPALCRGEPARRECPAHRHPVPRWQKARGLRPASEAENFSSVPEQRVKRRPI